MYKYILLNRIIRKIIGNVTPKKKKSIIMKRKQLYRFGSMYINW